VAQRRVTLETSAASPSSQALAAALQQFEQAADQIQLDPGLREILRSPQRETTVRFPVERDDGSIQVLLVTASGTTSTADPPRVGLVTIPVRISTTCGRSPCG
jgi:hypothetical protein